MKYIICEAVCFLVIAAAWVVSVGYIGYQIYKLF